MNYDEAVEHLKSAIYGSAYVMKEFRNGGLNKEIEDLILDYEFAVWSTIDRIRDSRIK